ncbi:MAG: YHS domain-containing protein, partial [Casimicrobiaceae bacterium]
MASEHRHKGHTHDGHDGGNAGPGTTRPLKDPVCGMTVTTASQHRLEYDGRPFYFCSTKCKSKFEASPEKYTDTEDPAAPSATETLPGAIYTCPMHPEIRQDHPGNCPKCG